MASHNKPSKGPSNSKPTRNGPRIDEDEHLVEGYRDGSVYEEEDGEVMGGPANAQDTGSGPQTSTDAVREGKPRHRKPR